VEITTRYNSDDGRRGDVVGKVKELSLYGPCIVRYTGDTNELSIEIV
jgi:hypothetical protein